MLNDVEASKRMRGQTELELAAICDREATMAREAKQREWIWEYFLKNCTHGRMIQELMTALPFPNDNLKLKQMLLLRSISMQMAEGVIDELTLDILRGLGELNGDLHAKESCFEIPDDCSLQFEEKQTRSEDGRNNEAELCGKGMQAFSERKRRLLPQTLAGLKKFGKPPGLSEGVGRTNTGNAETVVANEESVKERTESGVGTSRKRTENASESALCGSGYDRNECEYVLRPGESFQWELQMAVMVELAVQHLRGNHPDRQLFERAVTKYWGKSVNDSEEHERSEMVKARDQIKSKLWIVWKDQELFNEVADKYKRERVEDMLKNYLGKAWAEIGQTFLEKVGADVLNGVYKPVNSSRQRIEKARIAREDGVARDDEEEHLTEKSWASAFRGRSIRSRKKLKTFVVSETDTVDQDHKVEAADGTTDGDRNRDDGGTRAGHLVVEEEFDQQDQDVEDEGRANAHRDKDLAAVASVFENGVDHGKINRVLELEMLIDKRDVDLEARHMCEDIQPSDRVDQDRSEADPIHQKNSTSVGPSEKVAIDLTECSGATSSSATKGASEAPDTMCIPRGREKSSTNGGQVMKEAICGTEPQFPHDMKTVDNGPVEPPVAGASAVQAQVMEETDPSLIRKRNSRPVGNGTGATTTRVESISAETIAAAQSTDKTSDMTTLKMNLRRKCNLLDAAVEDPLPKILRTSRARCSLLDRNPTAQTFEWEEEDDIEESPLNSPSASRRVHLPPVVTGHRISPLLSTKSTATGGPTKGRQSRRRVRRWSEREVDTLKREVKKYGKGRWKLILEKNTEAFEGRTEVDLKDKWRNLERFEGIRET